MFSVSLLSPNYYTAIHMWEKAKGRPVSFWVKQRPAFIMNLERGFDFIDITLASSWLFFPLCISDYSPDMNTIIWTLLSSFPSHILLNHCFSQEIGIVHCAPKRWRGTNKNNSTGFQWKCSWEETLFDSLISPCTFFSFNIRNRGQ